MANDRDLTGKGPTDGKAKDGAGIELGQIPNKMGANAEQQDAVKKDLKIIDERANKKPEIDEAATFVQLRNAIHQVIPFLDTEAKRAEDGIVKSFLGRNSVLLNKSSMAFSNAHEKFKKFLEELNSKDLNTIDYAQVNADIKTKIKTILDESFAKGALLDRHTLPGITQFMRVLANLVSLIPGLGHLLSFAFKDKIENSHAGKPMQQCCGVTFFGMSTRREAAAARVRKSLEEAQRPVMKPVTSF